ncbi:MAG: DUF6807 family protein [Candidatus Hydrogenedentota bacterium]
MFKIHPVVISILLFTLPLTTWADFTIQDANGKVHVLENNKPVFTYNYDRVDPPESLGPDADAYWRSSYLYPVYDTHGVNITDDFPSDHYHHRGIFWSWPECRVGDRTMDVWTLKGVRQVFEKWNVLKIENNRATLSVQNVWRFDDDPTPVVRENVTIVTHAAVEDTRAIDFILQFKNITKEIVTFQGATDKGYGGFKFRLDATQKPFTFNTDDGLQKRDTWHADSPWVDTLWTNSESKKIQGVAIFQHPDNPDYPHDGWMIRHYGIIGPAWPHEGSHKLQPDESLTLKYRLLIHDGDTRSAGIGQAFDTYEKSARN